MRSGSIGIRLALVPLLALAALALVSPAAALGAAPSIEAESVSHITAIDATVEAQINPGGLETTYEVWVGAYPECIEERLEPCESTGEGPAGTGAIVGTIPASSSSQTISVDVGEAWHQLSPSSEYIYHVDATNSNWAFEGSAYGANKVFKTSPASAPSIDGESVSHISGIDATLEAEINTEGLETSYEFHLATPPCPSGCEHLQYIFTMPSGKLLGSFLGQQVSLDLTSAGVRLTPGDHYEYWLTATNPTGTASTLSEGRTFVASTGSAPSIDSESVSHLTSTDATLEAQINPDGLETSYRFRLEWGCGLSSNEVCPLYCNTDPEATSSSEATWSWCEGRHVVSLRSAEIPASFQAQDVSLDLNEAGVPLHPGTMYRYSIVAINSAGKAEGPGQTLTTPSETGVESLSQASGSTDPQSSTTTQSPPSASSHHHRHRHYRRHKRGLHQSNLHGAGRAG
jgi:hypothetical protein